MFNWEKFWYVQSVVAHCNGSFLIFRAFLSFPWSWLATLAMANLLGVLSGGQKLRNALLYQLPLLAFVQLVSLWGNMKVVIVAEGSNAASIITAILATCRYGSADEIAGSLGLLVRAALAFGNGGFAEVVMSFLADKEKWEREMVFLVLIGVAVVYCGFRFRMIHLSLRRRRQVGVEE